jgi:hypothetical protein
MSTPFGDRKRRRPNWDEHKPDSDPWEDQMRKDCAQKIILGRKKKKKKVRRNSPLYAVELDRRTKALALQKILQLLVYKAVAYGAHSLMSWTDTKYVLSR